MISLTEYANSFKPGAPVPKFNTAAISSIKPVNNVNQSGEDEFLEVEKKQTESNDTQKKNGTKIAIGIAAIIAFIAAIIKRKSIASFVTNHIHKSKRKDPTSVNGSNTGKIPSLKTPPQTPQTPAPIQAGAPIEKTSNLESKAIQKQPELPAKIELPKPAFKDNPTDEEKRAYINLVTPYLRDHDHKNIIWAIQEIEKYGTYQDLESITKFIQHKGDNDILLQLVKTSNKIGTPGGKDGAWMYQYISSEKFHEVPDEIYIEMFKGISKLGNGYGTFADLLDFVGKIPDVNPKYVDEYTDSLIDALIKVGDSSNIDDIVSYTNTNRVSEEVQKILNKIENAIKEKQS